MSAKKIMSKIFGGGEGVDPGTPPP